MSSPAEDSFWLFASVVDSIRTLYRKDLAVESLVFVYLLETLDKPLARRIIVNRGPCSVSPTERRADFLAFSLFHQVDAKIDPKTILSRWLQPMFIRILPWKDLLRVLDVTFFEGQSRLSSSFRFHFLLFLLTPSLSSLTSCFRSVLPTSHRPRYRPWRQRPPSLARNAICGPYQDVPHVSAPGPPSLGRHAHPARGWVEDQHQGRGSEEAEVRSRLRSCFVLLGTLALTFSFGCPVCRSKAMAALEEGRAAMRNARRQAGVAKGPVTPGPIGKR